MMIDVESYICQLTDLLKQQFRERLSYVGLQGSYLRKEATENSDLDIMVVIEELSPDDLKVYRSAIRTLEHSDKSCGFICGRRDLLNWNPLEICHLLHSTKDYYGVLQELVPAYTEQDIRNFIKLSVNNLYHEICHRYIHAEESLCAEKLPGAYKNVFFILQNVCFLKHGVFIPTKAELLPLLDGKDRAVLERSMETDCGKSFQFAESFSLLFSWCKETLQAVSQNG